MRKHEEGLGSVPQPSAAGAVPGTAVPTAGAGSAQPVITATTVLPEGKAPSPASAVRPYSILAT